MQKKFCSKNFSSLSRPINESFCAVLPRVYLRLPRPSRREGARQSSRLEAAQAHALRQSRGLLPANQSIYQSINQSIHQSMNYSINQPSRLAVSPAHTAAVSGSLTFDSINKYNKQLSKSINRHLIIKLIDQLINHLICRLLQHVLYLSLGVFLIIIV